MTASWVVYIDESGDEGFRFGKGSSDWFIVSAVVTQKATDLETVKLVDHVREQVLNRKDHEPLHFRKLKHEHRIPFLDVLSQADLKALVVLIHKPSIKNVEIFQQKNRMYFYAARLLLERVSWYCRDHVTTKTPGDDTAEIIFSNRGGMKYEEFRQYMNRLRHRTESDDVQINWNVIKAIKSQHLLQNVWVCNWRMQLPAVFSSGFNPINMGLLRIAMCGCYIR